MTDEKFEARMEDLERNIELFPDRKQFEDDLWQDDDLRKRTLEAARLEPQIWEDFKRERLLDMGTTPSITVDNSFAKLDLLLEEWVNGRISPLQRAESVAVSRTDARWARGNCVVAGRPRRHRVYIRRPAES